MYPCIHHFSLGDVKVNVTQAFDGTNPQLKIGDAVDDDRLMTANENNLKVVNLYFTENYYYYGASTQVVANLTIGGTPTQGQCDVYIEFAIP